MDFVDVVSPGSSLPRANTQQMQANFKSRLCKSEDDFSRITGEPGDVREDPDAYGDLALTFENVGFSVQVGGKEQAILQPISGHFEPGTLVAVMGPSGSGKTTLLDILAGKKSSHHGVAGSVHVNGRPRARLFQRISTYVAQDDILPAHLTVQEAVMFHMNLKQERPSKLTRALFEDCVVKSLLDLGLAGVKDSLVGDASVRGISGGQRRRTSLACGFAGSPQIMFCDEPTSGLSATDAEACVKYMRLIAHKYNITIMVVIHQPRLEVSKLFDNLVLLTSDHNEKNENTGGRCVYSGLMKDIPAYCAKVKHPVPQHANPTDFVMDLVTPGNNKSHPKDFVDYFEDHCKAEIAEQVELQMHNERKSVLQLLEGLHERLSEFGTVPKVRESKYGVRFRKQLFIVGARQCMLYLRDSRGIAADLAIAIGKGVILGLTYRNVGETGASSQLAFYFMLMMAVSIDGMKGMPKLISERKVMKMETSEALYSEWAYIIPFTLISWFQAVMSNTIFVAIIFAISTLPWAMFLPIWLWTTLLYLTMDSMFLMLSAVAKDTSTAFVMALPFFMLFLLFNGFSVNRASAPGCIAWIVDISPVAYAIEQALMAALHHFGTGEFKMIANMFGYEDQQGRAIGVMLVCTCVFRVAQVMGLKFLNNIQR